MSTYKICMYLQFVPGDSDDTYYPGEDKLWFEILLDEWSMNEYSGRECFSVTVDCNGFELPVEFMSYPEEKRESMRNDLMDIAANRIAEMLERNHVDEYTFDGSAKVDLMRIAAF